jgi:hypothetical protein
MTDYGGPGGLLEHRAINTEDLFEMMIVTAFGERMKTDDELCTQIWSALANVTWYHMQNHDSASYSFRAAGDLIASIRDAGNYMDWYCRGPYASITEEIRRTFKKAGWIPDDTPMICDEPGCLDDVTCGWPSEGGYRQTCSEHATCLHDKIRHK